jgi:hypothetical protein
MSINPGTQNIENLGNSAETLRLIFRALDLEIFAHDSTGKTSLFRPRPRFAQSHLPDHSNPSTFSRIPPAPTETHNSGAHPPRRAAPTAYCLLSTAYRLPLAARDPHGTVVEQCRREDPAFFGLPDQTLFHRFQILFFVRLIRPAHHILLTSCGRPSTASTHTHVPIAKPRQNAVNYEVSFPIRPGP